MFTFEMMLACNLIPLSFTPCHSFEQGKILGTTIGENAPFLERLLGLRPCVYQPSIPHLVYQYNVYVNYDSERMSKRNPEIPE